MRGGKTGLDYFSHSCTHDYELKYIIAKHREKGYYIFYRLLEHIYSVEGYFIPWDNKTMVLFCDDIGSTFEDVKIVIEDCLGENLFNAAIYKKHKILTSSGILSRYLKGCSRRKEVFIEKNYLTLTKEELEKSGSRVKLIGEIEDPPKKKGFADDSPEMVLAEFLLSTIKIHNKSIKDPNFQGWAKDFDLMIRVDKRDKRDIASVIKNVHNDAFWRNNILSAKKLREKWNEGKLNKFLNQANEGNEEDIEQYGDIGK